MSARADKLFNEYVADEAKVLDQVELINTLGFDGMLDRAVRNFLMDWNAAGDNDFYAVRDAAIRLHESLWPTVEANLREEANAVAEVEQAKWDADTEEMRDFYTRKSA